MDRHLTKNAGHKALKTTAQERAAEFPNALHADGGKLFCSCCNVVLDHTRKSTVADHLKAKSHLKRKASFEEGNERKKQRTLTTSIQCLTDARESRVEIAQEFTKMCLEANIPIEKADHPSVRAFLQRFVKNGGAIPGADQIRKVYLPDIYESEKQEIKMKKVAGKKLAIIVDETCDAEQRSVLHILAAPLEKNSEGRVQSYLLDTKFLNGMSHSVVAQEVTKTITEYAVDFENVFFFISDNAAYMKKAFKAVLQGLLTNCVHITCLAHIMELIVGRFQYPFKSTTRYMKLFRKLFSLPSGRKMRYLRHLGESIAEGKATMPPDPCATRWSSYFRAAVYHSNHIKYQRDFIQKEMQVVDPCKTLETLSKLLFDDTEYVRLKLELAFLAEKTSPLCALLDRFQSQVPVATEVVDTLEALQIQLQTHAQLTQESCGQLLDDEDEDNVPLSFWPEMMIKCKAAFVGAAEKLDKYMSTDGQPGYTFLKAVRILDPTKVTFLSTRMEDFAEIPGWNSVPSDQFQLYINILAPNYVDRYRQDPSGKKDLDNFWKSAWDRVPKLAEVALASINSVTTSADAERSFSTHNLIYTDTRRGFGEDNLRRSVFMCFNANK